MGEFRVSGFSLPRKWPTLATIKPSRRWGTRWWRYGQMWITGPSSGGEDDGGCSQSVGEAQGVVVFFEFEAEGFDDEVVVVARGRPETVTAPMMPPAAGTAMGKLPPWVA